MNSRILALGRLPVGVKNQTEAAYEKFLLQQISCGLIVWFEFEGIKFRLADNTFYTPDFVVQKADGHIEVHEVKGFWRDDARVKIKVTANKFPLFKFVAVTKRSNKSGGGWAIEEF